MEILHRGKLKENKISLTISNETPSGIYLKYNFRTILQIFNNLFLNSITALANSSVKKIHLSFSIKSENIIITLADTGKGIKTSEQDKIFEPLFTTTNGSGIGLTHVKSLLQNMGGNIHYLGSQASSLLFLKLNYQYHDTFSTYYRR